MIVLRSSVLALGISLVAGACSNGKNQAQAPLLIGDSFLVDKNKQEGNSSVLIGIKRSSLEKEFLLQGEVIRQPVVARFSNIKSRIVLFKENNKHLNLMEAIDGHSSSLSIPQNIVLTRFEIIKEENGVLYFDFAEGMSKIFISSDLYASDSKGKTYKPEEAWKTVELSTSFVEKAEADINNNLVIRQIAQIKSLQKKSNEEEEETQLEILQIPVEIKYYLSPYKENKGFISRESPGHQSVGFFEIAPRLVNGGGEKLFAVRWDERKPITYAISSNTPSEYVQAIKDGILYWNKALGKEVLRVTMAPEGIVAPDFHYNLIQWVDWNDAGYAYADAQMDPRTGEILHSSIFLTSVFGFSAKNKARQILRRLNFEKEKTKKNNTHLSLAGFQQNHLCDYELPSGFVETLSRVLNDVETGKANEGALLKLAQDSIRETVAHEMGHTLGLRHNFAGSLATTIPNEKRDSVFKDYVITGKAPETMVSTSSIMDYQTFQESAITGDQISRLNKAMEYDTKAIQQLYFDKKSDDMPLFCTDSDISKYIDCGVFDFGPSMLQFIKQSEEKTFENLPYTLMERFVAAKSVPPGQASQSLSRALPSSLSFALDAIKPRVKLLQALADGARFLKAPKGTTGDDNKDYLMSEIAQGGGIQAFLSPSRTEAIAKAEKLFEELLESNAYTRSEGAGGPFEFTAEDKDTMKRAAKIFFSNLPYFIKPAEVAIYKVPIKFQMETFGSELAQIFAQKATFVIEAAIGTISADIVAADGMKVKVEVPKFFFPDSYRKEAAAILNDRSDDLIWGYKAKADLRKQFRNLMDTSLKNLDITKLVVEDLPEELGSWVLVNRQILEVLKQ